MGHNTTPYKTTFVRTLAVAATVLLMASSASFAVEVTVTGPGLGAPGTPPNLGGKGEGPWAKAGSTLRRVVAAHSAHQRTSGGAPFESGIPAVRVSNGLILIDAFAADGDGAALLAALRDLGLENGTAFRHVVSGFMPLRQLDKAVELGSLRTISASLKPETNSSIDPTFGLVHDRSASRAMGLIASELDDQSYTGVGIKVGVLSDTYDHNSLPDYNGDGLPGFPATNATDDLANGDLPGGVSEFVALHTPGDVNDDDSSSFAAIGTSGSNTVAGDATQSVNRLASIRYNPGSFNENPVTAVVSYPDAEQYAIGLKPFTIEMWVRYETVYSGGLGSILASQYASTGNNRGWYLHPSGPSDSVPNTLTFQATSDGTSGTFSGVFKPWVPVANTWYHVAVARDDQSDLRMFINGTQIGGTQNYPVSIFNSSVPLRIGSYDSSAGNNRPFDGWTEDFRIVVGEALYTANFVAPTEPLASELAPLPGPVATTTVIAEGDNPGIDEGRAMMQLVHDVAPDASLSFHSAFNGLADFAQGILDLAADGADVIVDDIIYFAEPMFQDGIIAQAVDTVVGQGIPYFSSAGNSARKSYESPFVASGERLTVNGFGGPEERGMLHDFDPDPVGVDYMQSVTIPAGAIFTLVTQWDQPFASTCGGCPGAANDVDIYLVDDNLNILTSSVSDNLATGEPVEILQLANNGQFGTTSFHIMMAHYDVNTPQHPQPGSPPTLMKSVWFASSSVTVNEYNTNSAASYGHANADGAAAVGAAYYLDTPTYGQTPPLLESFSSAGGTPILFDTSGNALGVPDVREKPEFVAPDGTNTTFFFRDTSTDDADEFPESFPNFFGTSAAAPHAAAIAALMLEANPALSPADVYTALESTAVEMGPAGFDNDTGYGLIDATAALAQVTGGNLVPVAQNDIANTFENTLVSIPVLANDALGDPLTTITLVTDPPNGTAVINGTVIDYTPDTDYDGPDSFDYTIADDDGETSSATVNVTVTVLDVLPSAVSDNAATDEDMQAASINVLGNDDPGNAPATITSAGPISTEGGIVSTDGNTVTYDPPADYFGPDSFPYTITDNNGDQSSANVTMTVDPVNDAPVFDSDSFVKANAIAGQPYAGQTLAGSASDLEGNNLTYSKTAGPAWLTVAADGTLGGTPSDPGDVGVNPFEVTVTDDGSPAEMDAANLFVTVDAPAGNNLPTANGETVAAVLEDSGLANHVVLANDDFGGDGPSTGAIALGAVTGGIASVNTGGTANDPTDDSIDFTPAANFNGNAMVGYTIEDSDGDQASATLTIPVNPVNDAPVFASNPVSKSDATEGAAYGGETLAGEASDPEGTSLTYAKVSGPAWLNIASNGALSGTPGAGDVGLNVFTVSASDGLLSDTTSLEITVLSSGGPPTVPANPDTVAADNLGDGTAQITWANNSDNEDGFEVQREKQNKRGDWKSTNIIATTGADTISAINASGNGTFRYRVRAFNGVGNSAWSIWAEVTVTSDGGGGNLLPNAVNDINTTSVDTPVNGNVLSNDDQGDAPATITSSDAVGAPLGGGLALAGNGDYTYTPPAGLDGSDVFNYTITDNNGDTSNATLTITVNPVGGGVTINSATAYKVKGLQKVDLTWSGATTAVDIYRDGNPVPGLVNIANDGFETDHIDAKGGGSYDYQICETGGGTCSSTVNVVF